MNRHLAIFLFLASSCVLVATRLPFANPYTLLRLVCCGGYTMTNDNWEVAQWQLKEENSQQPG